mgnify:CR=1 FL=1
MIPVIISILPSTEVRDDICRVTGNAIEYPLALTKSYNANFDGDEVVIMPVKNTDSIRECLSESLQQKRHDERTL